MPASPADNRPKVAFQGVPGAYSHLACREIFPQSEPLPCVSFEDAFAAVEAGKAERAVIPIENSQAGRVADIHLLMPKTDLRIVGEHFLRVRHCLLGVPEAEVAQIKFAHSHPQALGQCRAYLRSRKIRPMVHHDTADSARLVAERSEASHAAIASALAGEIYGLDVLEEGVEDADDNTTRFVILAQEAADPVPRNGPVMTSFLFAVKNVPAALYKALGGFATNGVNMTKLESYIRGGDFVAAEFYADIEGHPDDAPVKRALEELEFHTRWVKILGSYPRKRERGKSFDDT